MRRRNEPTDTPRARYGEAWTPAAESKLTLVVPWIAQELPRSGPTTPTRPPGLPLAHVGWIGFHAAAPCSLLNNCHPQPLNAYTLRSD